MDKHNNTLVIYVDDSWENTIKLAIKSFQIQYKGTKGLTIMAATVNRIARG